jgi:hypothetical protein
MLFHLYGLIGMHPRVRKRGGMAGVDRNHISILGLVVGVLDSGA